MDTVVAWVQWLHGYSGYMDTVVAWIQWLHGYSCCYTFYKDGYIGCCNTSHYPPLQRQQQQDEWSPTYRTYHESIPRTVRVNLSIVIRIINSSMIVIFINSIRIIIFINCNHDHYIHHHHHQGSTFRTSYTNLFTHRTIRVN